MGPIEPNIFWLYYAGGTLFVLLLFLWRRPRRGMRLRLKAGRSRGYYRDLGLNGKVSPDLVLHKSGAAGSSVSGERSINVVFNYNGHSWDAYEVLGVPAGSSFAVVEAAYAEGLKRIEKSSHGILEAAFKAIQSSSKAG